MERAAHQRSLLARWRSGSRALSRSSSLLRASDAVAEHTHADADDDDDDDDDSDDILVCNVVSTAATADDDDESASDGDLDHGSSAFSVGWAEMQGRRPEQQDNVAVERSVSDGEFDDELFVAVFDGHTGCSASEMSAAHFHLYLREALRSSRADGGAALGADTEAGDHISVPASDAWSSAAQRRKCTRQQAPLRVVWLTRTPLASLQ